MSYINMRDFRINASEALRELHEDRQPRIVLRRGKPVARVDDDVHLLTSACSMKADLRRVRLPGRPADEFINQSGLVDGAVRFAHAV